MRHSDLFAIREPRRGLRLDTETGKGWGRFHYFLYVLDVSLTRGLTLFTFFTHFILQLMYILKPHN
jgi:hypothetical protein